MQPVDATASILMVAPIIAFFAVGRMSERIDVRAFLAMAVIALGVQIGPIQLLTGLRVGGWLVGWAMLTQIPLFLPTSWPEILLLAAMTAAVYTAAFFAGYLFGKYLRSRADPPMYG
ncbi:hypothetical protein BWQ93_12515 [Sphingopyxis sp. QXT-31]|uniref:hypothetical protein n=1 Tax=Sphingopyxis sp. QXT-31 TaxID=1357916 RepID=UPI0009791191|nr:hypothetical protein [Sphingopyxis sp. QXT-31]APZ99220.1 hypothetical protein BWQ93_12515 [Sphingopyxis sp. QXT-31]